MTRQTGSSLCSEKQTLKKNQKHRLERSAKPAGLRSF